MIDDMIDDIMPARMLGLFLMAALMWGSLIVNSFYDDDSPIQFRVLNCHVPHPTAAQCPVSLVWVGFR